MFHLAAQTIVGIANKSPLPTFESNIRGTWTLLEACRHAGVAARRRGVLGQGVRNPRGPSLPRGLRAGAAVSLRRLQGRRRPDRAVLLAHVRAARRGHPVCQPLRRRRPQPLAAGARVRAGGDRGPAPGDPLRRHAEARPACTSRTRSRRISRSGRCSSRAARPARRSTPAATARTRCWRSCSSPAASPVRASSPTCAAPASRRARSRASGWTPRSCAAMSGWTPQVPLEEGLRRTVEWYREYLPQLRGQRGDAG